MLWTYTILRVCDFNVKQDNPIFVISRDGTQGHALQDADRAALMDAQATRQRSSKSKQSKTATAFSSTDLIECVAVTPLNSTFLDSMETKFVTPEDCDELQAIQDTFVGVRRQISCVACQGTTEKSLTAVSCCCYAFCCKPCIAQFLVQTPKRCMACNLNWGPFRLSQVLVDPPCAEFTQLTQQMKNVITSKWNEAIESVQHV